MADNVVSSAGTADGAIFATDQRSSDSVHFPLTKLVWGPLDTFTLVDVAAAGLPIQDGGNSITVDNAGLTALATAISAGMVDVNITGQTGAVTVASHAVTNEGTFAVQVSSTTLPTGAATETTLIATGAAAQQAADAADLAVVALQIMDDWDETDRAKVNLIAGEAGITAGTGNVAANTPRVTLASDDFAMPYFSGTFTNTQALAEAVVVDDAAFTPASTRLMMAGFFADEASTDSVNEGDAGAARMTLDRKVIVNPQPHTAGGLTTARSLDLDETEEEIKASAGQVYGWNITNFATSVRHVKFYNATAANVTVGTTTPLFTLSIPGNATDDTMLSMMGAHGIAFDTAITWAATTGLADNDTGAPGAADVAGTVWYK